MTSRLVLTGIAALIALGAPASVLAAPAHADPGIGEQVSAEELAAHSDADFLASLHTAGITYTNPGQVITAGRAVCGLVGRGEPGLEVIADLKTNNPGFSTDGAATFAAIAAHSYCPQQLTKKQ